MILKRSKLALKVNPIFYGILVILSLLYFFIFDDITSGAITLNLALVFDPFNPLQPWKERPLWQRIWLFIHISFGIGILTFLAVQKLWFT